MLGQHPEIGKTKKLLKKASPIEKQYAKDLQTWLNKWLAWNPEDPSTQSDPPGDHPPPPPPRK